MQILPYSLLEDGYEPIALEFNQDIGILDIYHPSDDNLLESLKTAPETLILQCELNPIPLTQTSLHVQLTLEGETLKNVPLYTQSSISFGYDREWDFSLLQGIALNYLGTGQGTYQGKKFDFQGQTLEMGQISCQNPFYIKPFAKEDQNYQERQTTLSSKRFLTSPPGLLNTRVLRGYGGYYKAGLGPEHIQQIYYSLGSLESETRVKLHSSYQLKANSTPPPQKAKGIAFHPSPKEEEYLSLAGVLAAGYAHIAFKTESNTIIYNSYLGEAIADAPNQLNVYFKV